MAKAYIADGDNCRVVEAPTVAEAKRRAALQSLHADCLFVASWPFNPEMCEDCGRPKSRHREREAP